MGFFDTGKETTTSTSTQELPSYVTNLAKKASSKAQSNLNQGYVPYGYQRIEGFTPDQLAMQQGVRDMNPGVDYGQASQDAMTAINTPWMQFQAGTLQGEGGGLGDIGSYMNPYLDNVVSNVMAEYDRNAAKQMLGVNKTATLQGSYGDARHGVERSEMAKNQSQDRSSLHDRMMQDAYMQAIRDKMFDMGQKQDEFRMNQGAQEQGLNRQISGNMAQQPAGLQWLQALGRSGEQQQGLGQQSLDLAYNDFLDQLYRFDEERARQAAAVAGGLPYGQTTTSTQEQLTPSTFSQIAGGVLGGLSLF